ncbi:MAG: adenylate/guanylate cyclase domain-containing protein [Elusimicrobiota bacterium]
MTDLNRIKSPVETSLLVAFTDLTGFHKYMVKQTDKSIFSTMSSYFEFAGDIVEKAGGKVVKFIGDAILIVFPEERLNEGVIALKNLKDLGNKWMESRGIPSRHRISAHFGPVVCGLIGTKTDKRFDIYGITVNTAALLKSSGMAVTPQVFRKLKPETRKLLKKHTPPVTYIPVEESHNN